MTILHKISVVDISRNYSGILCSLLLADQGVNVTYFKDKYSEIDHYTHAVFARSKHCLVTDWTAQDSLDLLFKNLESADVIIIDWSTQQLQELGLDLDRLSNKYPNLIQLRITGFPKEYPRYAFPAHDGLIAASTALYTDISVTRSVLGLPPFLHQQNRTLNRQLTQQK
ncbi:CoA transferase [Acinetobacter sp. ULE_I057]|jgi:hypothetical protein|uniref:CoA transferase n=1 Tax=Acinetobacter sp. ULE_I057 TaxID=3373070 RepID=UPI003AF93733